MRFSQKRFALIGIAIGLCAVSTGLPAIAQTRNNVRQGLPGRRISGGTRGECASSQPVVALDAANKADGAVNEQSSVDFLLPKFDKVYPVEFKLRDSQGNTVHTQSLQTGDVEKQVSIQIPEESLQADLDYRWYFSVVCDAQDRAQNIVLTGQFQPLTPGMSNAQIETATEPTVTRHAAR